MFELWETIIIVGCLAGGAGVFVAYVVSLIAEGKKYK